MINQNFVILGVIFQAVGGFSYFIDTIKGKIQPNKVTWLLWTIAPLVAFAAEVSQGVGIQSLTTFIVGFVPLVIFIASFLNKKATWKITEFDIICGALSFAGIIAWYLTKVGNVAILFSIIADGLAAVPTIVKSYFHPESENVNVYFFCVINAGIGLLVIKNWNFEHFGFPAYLFVLNVIFTLLIKFKIGKRVRILFPDRCRRIFNPRG
jgi:hypothetical protein